VRKVSIQFQPHHIRIIDCGACNRKPAGLYHLNGAQIEDLTSAEALEFDEALALICCPCRATGDKQYRANQRGQPHM
jgi:hypothetical protein